jgi:protein-arginine kinase
MSTKSSALSQGSLTQLPMWFNGSVPEAEIIISTRIRVARNLSHHRFPAHASTHERTVVYEKVAAALRKQAQFRLFTTEIGRAHV